MFEIKKIVEPFDVDFFIFYNNTYDSFSIANKILKKQNTIYNTLKESINYFYYGYGYCEELYENSSTMDYLVLNRNVIIERKLLKILENNNQF